VKQPQGVFHGQRSRSFPQNYYVFRSERRRAAYGSDYSQLITSGTKIPKPMEPTVLRSRSLGRGYRARIRELAALGLSKSQILDVMPALRASELEVTLSLSPRRGRPPKRPTIATVEAVKRWRATQRPRTLRAAIECIDFLLEQLNRLERAGNDSVRQSQTRALPDST
jgi:hypothetical protein